MAAATGRRPAPRMHGDEGAVLVEFALIAPFFFLLICGIIEFGWIFAQDLDVRHGAREGARLVAVDYGNEAASTSDQVTELVNAVCSRMDHAGSVTVTMEIVDPPSTEPDSWTDHFAKVTVESDADTLTGFFDPLLSGLELQSEVETRIERQPHWIDTPWTAQQTGTCP
jgi:Flp pilus assembly protein TadG